MPKNGKSAKKARKTRGQQGEGVAVGKAMVPFQRDVAANVLSPERMPRMGAIGLPPMVRRAHRYCETRVVNGTTGALGTYVYSANGLFDPNITGTGHQPYGFDQMIAYYSKCVCESSSITVEVIPSAVSLCGVILSSEANVASTLASAELLSEPGRGSAALVYSNSGHARALFASWNKRDLYPEADPSDFTTVVNSNPTNQDYYTFYVQSPDLSSTTSANIAVVVTYDVTWQDPVTIASS